MRDLFVEIWGSIRRNRLRTCLTGFAVAWGIFMIIVLLGAGNGLMNAFLRDSEGVNVNTMHVYGGMTSIPYKGMKEGRWIGLKESDVRITGENFKENIDDVSPTLSVSNDIKMYWNGGFADTQLLGVYPVYSRMNKTDILYGRFIDSKDLKERRKCIVVSSSDLKRLMIPEGEWERMIGRDMRINDIYYKVVGVYKGEDNMWRQQTFIPYSTLQSIFSKGLWIDEIVFSFHGLSNEKESSAFEDRYRSVLNKAHGADPQDRRALGIWNRFTQNMQMEKASTMLNIALWVIGIFTLLSGIVGVSNIMLITVRERTHEFGIRKAIGAKPRDITRLIISESVTITTIFGYVGMILGLLACEYMNIRLGSSKVELMGEQIQVLKDPTVGMDVALEATLLLIVAGTLAGLIPALKAAKVKPIEALMQTK